MRSCCCTAMCWSGQRWGSAVAPRSIQLVCFIGLGLHRASPVVQAHTHLSAHQEHSNEAEGSPEAAAEAETGVQVTLHSCMLRCSTWQQQLLVLLISCVWVCPDVCEHHPSPWCRLQQISQLWRPPLAVHRPGQGCSCSGCGAVSRQQSSMQHAWLGTRQVPSACAASTCCSAGS